MTPLVTAEPGPVRRRGAPPSVNREFEAGFAAAIEGYAFGYPRASATALNAQFGPRYTEGYAYGWLEAECKRMSVQHFRQPFAKQLGCRKRGGLVTCTD